MYMYLFSDIHTFTKFFLHHEKSHKLGVYKQTGIYYALVYSTCTCRLICVRLEPHDPYTTQQPLVMYPWCEFSLCMCFVQCNLPLLTSRELLSVRVGFLFSHDMNCFQIFNCHIQNIHTCTHTCIRHTHASQTSATLQSELTLYLVTCTCILHVHMHNSNHDHRTNLLCCYILCTWCTSCGAPCKGIDVPPRISPLVQFSSSAEALFA